MLTPEFASILAQAGAEEPPIRSRWQHAAVPTWRRVPPTAVCEVAYTLLDGQKWLRSAARFVRWRPDRSPDDCGFEQLGRA
jgi:ATP-dependent DNA ligase